MCGPLGFLDLPMEIRDLVYSHVLTEAGMAITVTQRYDDQGRHFAHAGRSSFQPQLLRVCSKINSEAGAALYGRNTFLFAGIAQFNGFLKRIGSHRQQLRHIDVDFDIVDNTFTLDKRLVEAQNLQKLAVILSQPARRIFFDSVGSFALEWLRCCKPWFLEYNRQKGSIDACLEVMAWKERSSGCEQSGELEDFVEELRKCLDKPDFQH